jgi:cbb3-type cytochrome oxidase subunit 3
MIKLPKIKLNKIKFFFQKAPRAVADRAFLSFLLLFLISLFLGGLIFYQYNILAKRKEVTRAENPLQFKEKTYEDVLKIWKERENEFEAVRFKKYFDIFEAKPVSQPASQPALPEEGSDDYFLFEFYKSKGEILPSIEERAQIWEKMGLGSAADYQGSAFQNIILLDALKK